MKLNTYNLLINENTTRVYKAKLIILLVRGIILSYD